MSEIKLADFKHSPQLAARRLEHQIEIERKRGEVEVDNSYQLCCMRSDRRILLFIVQVLIAVFILGFSFYKLSHGNSCELNTVYITLIGTIVGFFLPNPKP
jgi:hypothetical protein